MIIETGQERSAPLAATEVGRCRRGSVALAELDTNLGHDEMAHKRTSKR